MDYKQRKVTLFKNINEDLDPKHLPLEAAINRIKTGAKHKGLVEEIQRCKDKEQRTKLKKGLPCALFSGVFSELVATKVDEKTGDVLKESRRTDESLTEHSGVVVLDWDGVEPHKLKPKLSKDPYILACWRSPSGNGVKALVKIDDPTRHREHYNSIIAAFSKKYGDIDPSNINPSRVCYDSYDPAIHINWDSWVWSGVLEEKKKVSISGGNDIGGLIYDYDYTKIQPIVKYLRNAEEGERNIKLNKAGFTLGGYVNSGAFPEGLGKHILLEEYKKINPGDDHAPKTLESGVRAGKNHPIYQFANHEEEFLREVGESSLDFLMDFDKANHELMRLWRGEIDETFTTGYSGLDPYFIWKKNQFIVNLGHSSVGKTWTAFWMLLCTSVIHGWKSIIFSAENKKKYQIRDLMQMAANKKLKEMTGREYRFYNEFVREHFEFIDNSKIYSYMELLDMADKILSRKHYDHFLIDPYNSLSRKGLFKVGGTHDYDNEAAAKFLSWCNNRGTGIWLNIHTATYARREKDQQGYSKKPFKDSAEGGGKWDSKADYFTVSHRITNHDDLQQRFVTDFSVEKVRDMDSGGQPHSYIDPFQLKMMYGSYFIDYRTGEKAFTPKLPNLTEI